MKRILFVILLISFLLPLPAAGVHNCDQAREWYDEGLLLSDNSEHEADCYRRAIELCPKFVAARNRLGELYKNQGKYRLASEQFQQARIEALASNTFSSRSRSKALFLESSISLGEIYKIQGQYARAAEEFAKALRIDPRSAAAQNQLQYVYKRQHRYDNVLSPYNRMLVNGIFTRQPGLTLPENSFSADIQFRLWTQTASLQRERFGDQRITLGLSPEKRETDIRLVTLSMRYGLTNNLTLGLIPKYFSRSLTMQLDTDRELEKPTIHGLGDTELLIKYHLWGQRNRHLSTYLLVNLPTGEEVTITGSEPLIHTIPDENGQPVERRFVIRRSVPLGSKNVDLTPGLAFTLGHDPFVFHADMQYRFTDHKLVGDEFLFNCGAIYRINRAVNATLELNYRWRDEVTRPQQVIAYLFRPNVVGRQRTPAGPVEVETIYTEAGGHSLFLAPGMQFTVANKFRLEMGLQIPLVTPSSGWASEVVYQCGLTYTF